MKQFGLNVHGSVVFLSATLCHGAQKVVPWEGFVHLEGRGHAPSIGCFAENPKPAVAETAATVWSMVLGQIRSNFEDFVDRGVTDPKLSEVAPPGVSLAFEPERNQPLFQSQDLPFFIWS